MNNAEFFNQLVRSRCSVFPDQFEAGKKVDDAIIKEVLTKYDSTSPFILQMFAQ